MARIVNRRSTFSLMMIAAVSLSGCVVKGGGGNHVVNQPAPTPVPTYQGCPALQGSGAAGLVSLNALRGRFASLESYSAPNYYIRHYGKTGPGVASKVYSPLDQDEATFRVVPGLADNRCISLVASTGDYLRHRDGDVGLDPATSDLAFAEDATFCPRPGLADPNELSFETCDTPDGYLNIDDYDGHSDTYGTYVDVAYGAAFDRAATFLVDERFPNG